MRIRETCRGRCIRNPFSVRRPRHLVIRDERRAIQFACREHAIQFGRDVQDAQFLTATHESDRLPIEAFAPRSVMGTSAAFPLATSSDQTPKFRSNTMVFPSFAMLGHTTRPFLNDVSARAAPPSTPALHRFSEPPRSDMK